MLPPAPRILIVKLWAIGDMIMATPIVDALRKRYPGCHISWLAHTEYASVLEGAPGIDEVIPLDATAWLRWFRRGRWIGFLRETRKMRRSLRERKFDIVINYSAGKWWGVWFNIAPKSYGLLFKPLSPLRLFYTKSIAETTSMHTVRFHMLLAPLLDCPADNVVMVAGHMPNEGEYIDGFRATHSIDPGRPLVVMSPFSSNRTKDWPVERYATLADHLAEKFAATIVVSHSSVDRDRARELDRLTNAPLVLPDSTTLLEYIALLRAANLVVCNDSSAMHLTAAVGTPLVALCGPIPYWEKMPLYGPTRIVAAHPKETRPIDEVPVEDAIRAADEMLSETASETPR
ncbi:MAG: glycosyltransferase family 9 protein [Capsulimonadaceae bacterium]|nr:glycosyltransferase family 9 protein [Capsulimonadaceae bacterium]